MQSKKKGREIVGKGTWRMTNRLYNDSMVYRYVRLSGCSGALRAPQACLTKEIKPNQCE